jgi:hypothetical protein
MESGGTLRMRSNDIVREPSPGVSFGNGCARRRDVGALSESVDDADQHPVAHQHNMRIEAGRSSQ